MVVAINLCPSRVRSVAKSETLLIGLCFEEKHQQTIYRFIFDWKISALNIGVG